MPVSPPATRLVATLICTHMEKLKPHIKAGKSNTAQKKSVLANSLNVAAGVPSPTRAGKVHTNMSWTSFTPLGHKCRAAKKFTIALLNEIGILASLPYLRTSLLMVSDAFLQFVIQAHNGQSAKA